jgi:hypothetical protein
MTKYRFVEDLPDLIQAEEYADHPDGRLIRFRIRVTGSGVEILGDAFRPEALEKILTGLGREGDRDDGDEIDQMLCG